MPTLYIADAERDADMKNLSRKEAAKVLEDMKSKGEIPKAAVTQWKRNTALDMAIEALKYSEVPNSSDCISRQAAIDALAELARERFTIQDCFQIYLDALTDADKKIQQLPPIQPKRGKWIHHPEIGWGETWLCDQCGEKTTSTVMGKPRANFCPMCGADMRGEQDG